MDKGSLSALRDHLGWISIAGTSSFASNASLATGPLLVALNMARSEILSTGKGLDR